MKTSRILLISALAFSAIAMAQAPNVRKVSFGQGVAKGNQSDRRAEFNYEVGKRRQENGQIVNIGRFEFDTQGQNNSKIKLTLERPENLGSNDNNCEFAGKGVMAVKVGNTITRTPVRIMVRVQDIFNPQPQGGTGGSAGGNVGEGDAPPTRPMDTIAVRVVPAPAQGGNGEGSNPPAAIFEFAGKVVRGNLVVVRPQGNGGGTTP